MNIVFKTVSQDDDLRFLFFNAVFSDLPMLFGDDLQSYGFDYFRNRFYSLVDMNGFYHDFYIVNDDDKRIGYIATYKYRANDSNCFIETSIEDALILGKVVSMFLNHLHREYGLRKVFVAVKDMEKIGNAYNRLGFEEEGCLKEYVYCLGNYLNLHYLSYNFKND